MSLDTRGNDPQRLLPQSIEDRLLGLLGFSGGMALLGTITLVWISLLSWSINDPSLTHATANAPRNMLGGLGAVASDLLLQTFGLATVLALLPPMLWGAEMLTRGQLSFGRSKMGYYPIAVLALAGALSTYPVISGWPLNHSLGGAIGDGVFSLSGNLFKLINKDRADLAAALLLNIAAIVLTAKCIAFDLESWVKAMWAERTLQTAGGDVVERGSGLLKGMQRLKTDAFASGSYASGADASGLYDAGPSAPDDTQIPEPSLSLPMSAPYDSYSNAPDQSWRGDGYAPFAQALDQLAVIAKRQEAHLAALAAQGYPSAPDTTVAAQPPRMSPTPGHPAQAQFTFQGLPVAPNTAAGVEYRGDDFDDLTDAESKSIAVRFACKPAVERMHDMDAPETAKSTLASALGSLVAIAGETSNGPRQSEASQSEARQSEASQSEARKPEIRTSDARPHDARAPDGRNAEARIPSFMKGPPEPLARQWKRPSLNLLKRATAARPGPELTQTVMRGNARLLEDVLNDFGVKGEVKDIRPGPVVTLYELEPARGTKSSRVIGLADDIARSMSVTSVRAAVVSGRNAIGLELPNMRREPVFLREMLESDAYKSSDATLPITLGKSISGEPVVADLARMPHLLVAGTTGSGKSVGVNAFILSLLYRHSPNECRFLMIDPKMLELSVYNGIPHLLTPVVTDPHKAVVALNWAVREMEERYKRMATLSVRNIDVFNNRVRNALKRGEMLSRTVQTGFDRSGQAVFEKQKMTLEPMAHIVIVVDEFADLMVVAGKEVEGAVQRLAQMARAAGIHLIMATQRPSVDVITGTIKANFPTRISFKVTSKIDSRTILNEQGAEQLLGQGDMLYSSSAGQIVRVHGAFVSDEEVEAIAGALREQGAPQYVEGLLDAPGPEAASSGAGNERDVSESDLYDRAVAIIMRDRKASVSYLQRRLSIGYNRAADLIERMEREGLISPATPTGKRDILANPGDNVDAA